LTEEHSIPEFSTLLEQVVERDNMVKAYRRVRQNRGASGIDGMSVEALHDFLQSNWPNIKARLLSGTYVPQPVRRVEIPKPGGGTRPLGVPTVLDRLIQQAILQKLSPLFDPEFSEYSYGFRPGRSAQQAVLQARRYQRAGKRWVVDMDLEKFFDEVSHDILMARVGRKVRDRKLLYLIRLYLQSGVMIGGVVSPTPKGTPQGGPLSPLLSNILLDDLDKELERRGHSFCRYADDCNIYVNSRLGAERVMALITRFVERQLKLKVNRTKSAVARPWQRKFLGYSFTAHKESRVRVAAESVKRFRGHLKQLFRKGRGRNLAGFIRYDLNPVLRGWINYFCLAENKGFAEDLDKWVRRRLRLIIWRQWKRTWTRFRNLMKRGIAEERAAASASNGRGSWYNAGASHMNQALPKKYFDGLELLSLLGQLRRFGI
jgi:group II intron reverse transcriptase/maturase